VRRAFVRAQRPSRILNFAQYTDRLEASEAVDFIQVG
jgi:hypothetical protein